ncbi:hypothetical protein UT300013_08730 [Paraclostridium sordellii]
MNKKFFRFMFCLAIMGIILPNTSFAAETDKYDASKDYTIRYSNSRKKASADEIINFARKQLGKPYVWGASGPNAFDCSGFIYYVFSNNGYDMPRTTVEGYWNSPSIKKVSSPRKGDLIFFKGTYGGANHPSHMGIMINENEFIHASSGSNKVQIDNKNNSYYKKHFLGYGNIIPESANKKPVYRIETGGFVGIERAKYEVGFLKGQFGWDGHIKPNKNDNKYSIETGGFVGIERAKYEVGFLKGQFGWDGHIKPNKNDNKYSIETGGFVGIERAEYEVGFLKSQFGWDSRIEPNGDKPNEYKLIIDGFVGEDEVNTAKQRLEGWTGWWTTILPDDSNEYKIIIDGFVGEDEVNTAKQRLEGWTGWWTTILPDDSNEYKIIIDGFVGEDAVKDAQRRLESWTGWWTTYVFTGEYV